MLSDPPSVLVNRGTTRASVVDDTFEKPLLHQLQSKKQRWDEFSSTEQNELAIIVSATSVPSFQNQCKMLFTELDGAFSSYCCVTKSTWIMLSVAYLHNYKMGEHKTAYE